MFPLFFFALIFGGPILLGTVGYFWTRRSSATPDQATGGSNSSWSLPLIVNSAVLYALAFNITFFFQELFLVLPKAFLAMEPTLFHNNHNWLVSHPAEDLLQGTGALAILGLGLCFAVILARLRSANTLFKLFALWMVYHGLTQSLPQIAGGVIQPGSDLGDVMRFLKIGEALAISLAMVGALVVIGMGLILTRLLLELAPSSDFLRTPQDRTKYILQSGTIASILGFIFIVPFRLPPFDQIEAPFLIALFPLPWTLANAWRVTDVRLVGNIVHQKIFWWPVVALIVLLVIFQSIFLIVLLSVCLPSDRKKSCRARP